MTDVGLVSLGCPKNLVDSEVILACLDKNNYQIVQDIQDADIIIVNTCCFIKEAYTESIETIQYISRLKKHGKCSGLIICGCLVEKMGRELFKKIPEVDALLGTTNQNEINTAISRISTGKNYFSPKRKQVIWDPESLVKLTPSHFAYIKISEGCSNKCTFCIIPSLRGQYRSRPFESIIQEARELASAGIKEIILVGQDTTRYGLDLYGKKRLSELLKALNGISKIHWIRLLYCYPNYVDDTLLQTIESSEKVCNYMDLSIQHISDPVLKRMGRKQTADSIKKLIGNIRNRIPEVGVRTTFIVGFPGETEEDFARLLGFIEETRFERLGIFTYSAEEGTPACMYPDQVPDEIKNRRFEEAMILQQQVSASINKSYLNKVVPVLIDGHEEGNSGQLVGRTQHDAPEVDGMVYIEKNNKLLKSGDLISIKITDTKEYDLVGEPVK